MSKEISTTRVKSVEGHSKNVFSCRWNPHSTVLTTGFGVLYWDHF